jgi:hypothetical protein
MDVICNERKLYAFGGCHVIGHNVGDENSFVSIVSASMRTDKVYARGNLNARNFLKSLDRHETDFSDSILILQFGHYETTGKSLIPFYGKKTDDSSYSYFESSFDSVNVLGYSEPKIGLNYNIREYLKILFFFIRELFRCPVFDSISFEGNIVRILSALKKSSAFIVVVSTFPTRSFVHNIYRKRAGVILKRLAQSFNCRYIDVYGEIDKRMREEKVFCDNGHLNQIGHKIVAERIIAGIS